MRALDEMSRELDAVHTMLEDQIRTAVDWPATQRLMEVNGRLLRITHPECFTEWTS